MNRSGTPVLYRALWAVAALALVAAFVVWGIRINSSFSARPVSASTPVPSATTLPLVATVYSNIGPPDPRSLCAELSPVPKEVTVESTTGVVIATIQCRR